MYFPRFGTLMVVTIEQFCLCSGKLDRQLASAFMRALFIRRKAILAAGTKATQAGRMQASSENFADAPPITAPLTCDWRSGIRRDPSTVLDAGK